jgi:hypothetical protein
MAIWIKFNYYTFTEPPNEEIDYPGGFKVQKQQDSVA